MNTSEFLKKVIAFASSIAPEIVSGQDASLLIVATDNCGQTIAEMGTPRNLISGMAKYIAEDRSEQHVIKHASELAEIFRNIEKNESNTPT